MKHLIPLLLLGLIYASAQAATTELRADIIHSNTSVIFGGQSASTLLSVDAAKNAANYAGSTPSSCSNQVVTSAALSAAGVFTTGCSTLTLASAMFANQGTTTTVLHGNASGNPSFAAVALGDHATQATNTVVGNATSGTAAPTALPVSSCSTSSSALIWTANTGFGCNTAINAATLGGATFAAPGAIGGGTAGTGTFTALTLGTTSGGTIVSTPNAGTNLINFNVSNSGGSLEFGLDNSAGGGYGLGAYATAIYRPASTAFGIIRAGTLEFSISSTGAVSTAGTFTVGTINSGTGLFTCESSGLILSGVTTCVASAKPFKNPLGELDIAQSDRLDLLHPAIYTYKDQAHNAPGERVGLYAEDVAAMDSRCAEYDNSGALRTYDDRCVLAYLIADRHRMRAAIQEQQAQIDELRAQVIEQRAILEALSRDVSGYYASAAR